MLERLLRILTYNTKLILILILAVSLLLRIWRIDYPITFIFDEVYYAFTAQEYLKGNKDAWIFSSKPPEGRSYAWVNPPLPQESMALSMFLFNNQASWTWRLPGVILGILSIYLVFLIGKTLTSERIGLVAAFLFSLDGLNFVQSRTAMLDIYLVTFVLASFYATLRHKFLWAAIFFGLAFSSKWTAVYLLGLIILYLIKNRQFSKIALFALVPPIIYLLVYSPFFLSGYNLNDFRELLKQQVWYHTHLKATHDYASSWHFWPFNFFPVWYFVDYHQSSISNIFASGNPLLFWSGALGIVVTLADFIKKKSTDLFYILLGFLIFWLPWSLSPRIMFLYYFAPAVPFMSLALATQLDKLWPKESTKNIGIIILVLIVVNFLLIYPVLTGLPLPRGALELFFRITLAKNPF